MSVSRWACVLGGVAVWAMGARGQNGAGLGGYEGGHARATGLRCEYRADPLGVEEARPRLMWVVESDRRGEVQTAYRVLVASSSERLAHDEGDLWDSGRVESSETAHVEYAGRALGSREVCHWKVRVWDGERAAGHWSEPARWEMGLLEGRDWGAAWIAAGPSARDVEIVSATYFSVNGAVRADVTERVRAMVAAGEAVVASNEALGGDPARDVPKRLEVEYRVDGAALRAEVAENATVRFAGERIPYLRRSLTVRGPVARARLYATALGVYEMSLNGERVGDEFLAPGWTDYRRRVQYRVHDVTAMLRPGENMLGAIVGPGWFAGRAGLFHARAFYGRTPALLARLEITYEDGSVDVVATDGGWVRRDGPILSSDIMDGEVYDARGEVEGWCAPGADADGWSPVEVVEESRVLVAQVDAPVRALMELPAISVGEPAPGRWTFDLGQNMVGVVRLRVSAGAGTVVTIRHAEMLNPDGTIYTQNLRGAAATDTYVCRGGSVEEWTPRFTFHGFRYVEVSGLGGEPGVGAVTGIVVGSDLEPVGEFACSDARLNRLQSNIVWGLRGNYLSVPTDCPQRDERMGWMADTQVFVPTAAYNADIAPFMTKWMADVADAQREDGAHSDVAPAMSGLSYGTPAWADAGTIVPWAMYEAYGDRRILERHIDSMMRWVDWCEAHSTGLIRDRDRGNDYGDWLAIGSSTSKELIGTAYFARSADIVARSLRVLGRDEEAARYAGLFERIRGAFIGRYVDAEGHVEGRTQTGYVLGLRFGLLPRELRGKAFGHLIEDVRSRGWRQTTGFVGVSELLPALGDDGRPDAAYRLLMQDAFPSWLFSVRHGATTIWERWDGWTPRTGPHPDWGMNSFNHYALGSCGQWLFAGVGGIEREPESPGFSRLVIRPRIDGPLTWARTRYRSIRGEIATEWRLEDGRLTLVVEIPANARAVVYVPSAEGDEVLESGRSVRVAEGVRVVGREGDSLVLRVGSGRYEFSSRPAPLRWGNPVVPGWYADPEVAVFDDGEGGRRVWIYPTYSAPYDEQVHFDAFSSTDMVRWTKHERVLDAGDVSWARRAMWAPSVVEKDGKYFFFFGANDIQSDEEVGGIGVAVADSPAGPFADYLGKPLIGAFHNGAQPIDQFVFRDEDGTDYLIYGGWRHCNIARLRDDYRGFEAFEGGETFREITPRGYVEGPFMFVREGKYYFMWSEGGWTGPDYRVAYAIGDSPLGPFERIGTILEQDPEVATGAGHHSVLRLGEEWFIVYHRRPRGETDGNHRVVCIDRMRFDGDGRIEPVVITDEGVPEVDLGGR